MSSNKSEILNKNKHDFENNHASVFREKVESVCVVTSESAPVPVDITREGGRVDYQSTASSDLTSTEALYEELNLIDPCRAAELHPNDRRKIIRSLQVWQQSGRRHSDLLAEQRGGAGGSSLGGGLRYPAATTLLLWTTCQQDVLLERLDKRVDDMLQRGLIDELLGFHKQYNKKRLRDLAETAAKLPQLSEASGDHSRETKDPRCGEMQETSQTALLASEPPVDDISSEGDLSREKQENTPMMNDPPLCDMHTTTKSIIGTNKKRLHNESDESLSNLVVNESGQYGRSPSSKRMRYLSTDIAPIDTNRTPPTGAHVLRKLVDTLELMVKVDEDSTKTNTSCQQPLRDRKIDISLTEVYETKKSLYDKNEEHLRKENIKTDQKSVQQRRIKQQRSTDYTTGIFQSIGFKEFHEYLILPEEERVCEKGRAIYEKGVEALKQVTRRYAKKQLKWINNRFIRCPDREVLPVYALDASDPSQWEESVGRPARQLVTCLLEGTPTDCPPVPREPEDRDGTHERHECVVCERVFIGRLQWQQHTRGSKHRKMAAKKTKEEKQREWQAQQNTV